MPNGTMMGQVNSTVEQIDRAATRSDRTLFKDRRGFSWRTLAVIVVFWLIWGLVYSVNLSIVKHGMSFGETLQLAFSDAIIWALLTPLVLWIGRRLPIRGPYLVWKILLHIPIGVAVVTVHDLLDAWHHSLSAAISGDPASGLTVAEYFQRVVPYKWYSHLFLYAAIVGLVQLLEHRRQLVETQTQMAMLRAHLAEAQLETLRLQLQPHFLFNCLNTISGLIDQRPSEARRMIGNLAELLRLALDTEESEVPLQKELHFVRTYLQIEQIRFGNRLQVEESIPEACLAELVPSFILQPLVENSVRHGLSSQSRGGRIELKASMDDQYLLIEVRDDGVGISSGANKQGTGLSSVRSRIQQLYGKEHDLQLESSSRQGTRILIKLPRRTT